MKEITGYEGLYWIDEYGHIYNRHGKSLKGVPDKDGYLRVLLYKNKKRKLCGIHRLVALQFIPNTENLSTVNHKDGDKSNNVKDNLEWMTHSDNIKHAHQSGLNNTTGENNGAAKLTEKQVLEIREKYVPRKYSLRRLGNEYGVHFTIILDIINKKTWTHI